MSEDAIIDTMLGSTKAFTNPYLPTPKKKELIQFAILQANELLDALNINGIIDTYYNTVSTSEPRLSVFNKLRGKRSSDKIEKLYSPAAFEHLSMLYPVQNRKYALRSLYMNYILLRWGLLDPLPFQSIALSQWTGRMEWRPDMKDIPKLDDALWDVYFNVIKGEAASECARELYGTKIPYQINTINDTMSTIREIEHTDATLKQKYTDYRFDAPPDGVPIEYIGAIHMLGERGADVEALVIGFKRFFIDNMIMDNGRAVNVIDPERQPRCHSEMVEQRIREEDKQRYGVESAESSSYFKPNRNTVMENIFKSGSTMAPASNNNIENINSVFTGLKSDRLSEYSTNFNENNVNNERPPKGGRRSTRRRNRMKRKARTIKKRR